jgi:hypothetical protein
VPQLHAGAGGAGARVDGRGQHDLRTGGQQRAQGPHLLGRDTRRFGADDERRARHAGLEL